MTQLLLLVTEDAETTIGFGKPLVNMQFFHPSAMPDVVVGSTEFDAVRTTRPTD